MRLPIYLDYNASTPVYAEVLDAMLPFLSTHFGNPSSAHIFGRTARNAVETARARTAGFLGCRPEEVVFTSGGTESNNYAILGAAHACRGKGKHIITSAVEHPAVTEVCKRLAAQGFKITVLPVDGYGLVSAAELETAIRPETSLISIMHANNEVGTIQPIRDIARIAKQNGILFHTDAAQSAGKIPVNVKKLGVDLLSLAGHKFYASKGVGALFIRRGVQLEKLIHGAGHELGRRSGTENTASIVGFGKACELAARDLAATAAHLKAMRDGLHQNLESQMEDLRLNGHPVKRLPNTLNISFRGISAGALLAACGRVVAASPGSACHSGAISVSPMLTAMGVPLEWAQGAVRLSVGKMTSPEEIEICSRKLIKEARVLLRNTQKKTKP